MDKLFKGWKNVKLQEIAKVRGGKRIPKGKKFSDEETLFKYIRVSDMEGGSVLTKNVKSISEDIYKLLQNYKISKNDVYLSIAGTIGKAGTIPGSLDKAIVRVGRFETLLNDLKELLNKYDNT